MTSCALSETDYSTLDTDKVFTSESGFDGLVNACYENIYLMYGKVDGIAPMESGTDLWLNDGRDANQSDFTNYVGLNTSANCLSKLWGACYSTIALANTVEYYADKVKSSQNDSISPDSVKYVTARKYEAIFLRGFCYFHLVEQWGNVTLNTTCIPATGAASSVATRNTEEEIYEQIIADLTTAAAGLPEKQPARGMVTKNAAKAMLAKAWLQRSRLYAKGSAEYVNCAEKAYEAASDVIENGVNKLYPSTATQSGSTRCWLDDNNKNNQEFVFAEAVDHDEFHNPEFKNRGRTAQYYTMKIESYASNFGVNSNGIRYRRDNTRYWRPTLYLLQDCFEPKPDTKDTRFSDSFYYKYYIGAKEYAVSLATWAFYGKDTVEYKKHSGARRPTAKDKAYYTITSKGAIATDFKTLYPGVNYYADNGTLTADFLEVEGDDDALGCFTPNWDLNLDDYKDTKYLAAGPNTYLPDGKISDNTYYDKVYPSLRKYSCFKYCLTSEFNMMDIPIIRLTDIYLIAAEAAVAANNHLDKALEYINAVRHHAALSTDAQAMEVGQESLNLDFIMKERARELCGEQWRWYDLKRVGWLNQEYLGGLHKNPFIQNFTDKFLVRPIPQSFLDEISNADEYGNNGY